MFDDFRAGRECFPQAEGSETVEQCIDGQKYGRPHKDGRKKHNNLRGRLGHNGDAPVLLVRDAVFQNTGSKVVPESIQHKFTRESPHRWQLRWTYNSR